MLFTDADTIVAYFEKIVFFTFFTSNIDDRMRIRFPKFNCVADKILKNLRKTRSQNIQRWHFTDIDFGIAFLYQKFQIKRRIFSNIFDVKILFFFLFLSYGCILQKPVEQ